MRRIREPVRGLSVTGMVENAAHPGQGGRAARGQTGGTVRRAEEESSTLNAQATGRMNYCFYQRESRGRGLDPQARPPPLAKAGSRTRASGHPGPCLISTWLIGLLAFTSAVTPVKWWAALGGSAVKGAHPEQGPAALGLPPQFPAHCACPGGLGPSHGLRSQWLSCLCVCLQLRS